MFAKEIVGHESSAISRQYTHLTTDDLRSAMQRLPDVTNSRNWRDGARMEKVTPYELATLASRIDPERRMKDPSGALKAAVDLLRSAKDVLRLAAEEDRRNEQEEEEEAKYYESKCVGWGKGIKEITGEQRRDRATSKFTEFVKHESPGDLGGYKRDGFTLIEIHQLGIEFAEWKKQPKRKQGRRRSEHDGRLRTELVGLVPTKPRKRA